MPRKSQLAEAREQGPGQLIGPQLPCQFLVAAPALFGLQGLQTLQGALGPLGGRRGAHELRRVGRQAVGGCRRHYGDLGWRLGFGHNVGDGFGV